jgi:hypothetical protein
LKKNHDDLDYENECLGEVMFKSKGKIAGLSKENDLMMAELEIISDADVRVRGLLDRKGRLDRVLEKAEGLVGGGGGGGGWGRGGGKYY